MAAVSVGAFAETLPAPLVLIGGVATVIGAVAVAWRKAVWPSAVRGWWAARRIATGVRRVIPWVPAAGRLIRDELQQNGGSSMKDRLDETADAVVEVQAQNSEILATLDRVEQRTLEAYRSATLAYEQASMASSRARHAAAVVDEHTRHPDAHQREQAT